MCLLVSCGILKSYQKEYYLVMTYYKPVRIPRVSTYHLRKPKIFISFNYTYDHGYRYLMSAWNANPCFDFTYDDRTPYEIRTDSVSKVKAVLTTKIKESSAVVVIIGSHANELHPDRHLICYRNWQNYEIAKAKELGKRLVAVQVNRNFHYPQELIGVNATRVYSFSQNSIIKAVRGF